MTTEFEYQMLNMMKQQRQSTPVNGFLSAAVASSKDGKIDIGDLIVASGICLSFAGIGVTAGFGNLLQGNNLTVASGVAGDFIQVGVLVAAGRIAIDALSLIEWWEVTFGKLLEWYGERHPTGKKEKPMVINYRNIAKSPKSVTEEATQYSFPGGGSVPVVKLEEFLLGALEIGKWSRDHWCNSEENMVPGVNLLSKAQWYGIREMCELYGLWETNDRVAVRELIEDITPLPQSH